MSHMCYARVHQDTSQKKTTRTRKLRKNLKVFGKSTQQKHQKKNKAYWVQTETTITVECMTRALQNPVSDSYVIDNSNFLTASVRSLKKALESKSLYTFLGLLNDYLEIEEADVDEIFNKKLHFAPSTFISAHKVPSISTEDSIGSVL